ncbi:MAG: hypothetical protein JSW31_09350 [Burkholderiales bacterium]|nr:MAG: hypothetical protein JSW31_09350 [Burkholderiales bacterium]
MKAVRILSLLMSLSLASAGIGVSTASAAGLTADLAKKIVQSVDACQNDGTSDGKTLGVAR